MSACSSSGGRLSCKTKAASIFMGGFIGLHTDYQGSWNICFNNSHWQDTLLVFSIHFLLLSCNEDIEAAYEISSISTVS